VLVRAAPIGDGEPWKVYAYTSASGTCVEADVADKTIAGGCGWTLYPGSGFSGQVGGLPESKRQLVFGVAPRDAKAVEITLSAGKTATVPTFAVASFHDRFFVLVSEPGEEVGSMSITRLGK
jgi:hypothetical protein